MILCCGEALIDMLPRETPAGEPAFAPHVGGAVFNTAIALGRLEIPTGFFTGLSSDFLGQMLRRALSDSGVDTRFAAISDRPTTLAFVQLDGGHATYTFYDENTAGRGLARSDLPDLPASVDALFFGGISLISEPGASTYEAMLTGAAADRVIMLDPNIRPGFITDPAAYRARLERLLAKADIVKLSDEDLAWLEEEKPADDMARAVLDRGPKLVIITHGAGGSVGYTRSERVPVEASQVQIVDTVGAGDTFNAGLLAALHDQGILNKHAVAGLSAETIEKALRLGNAAAAVTVSRAGANPPRRAELSGIAED